MEIVHREKKGSTLLWFIIGILPWVNLIFLFKAAELISGHKKIVRKNEFLKHKRMKVSTTLGWFFLFLLPIILIVVALDVDYYLPSPYEPLTLILLISAIPIALCIALYMLWKISEVVSGHDAIFNKVLVHLRKKDSTLFWFIIGIIPIVDLLLLWELAGDISGHDEFFKQLREFGKYKKITRKFTPEKITVFFICIELASFAIIYLILERFSLRSLIVGIVGLLVIYAFGKMRLKQIYRHSGN